MIKPGLARYPGMRYPAITNISSGEKLRVAVPFMTELRVSFVYDQRVTFEIPNGKGGHKYLSLSYEQIEYPPYSIACRAAAATDAQGLYPDDLKGRSDRQKKIEAQRQVYIDTHWRDFYDGIVRCMTIWHNRQTKPTPYYLIDDTAVERAVRYQCAIRFCVFDNDRIIYGKRATCVCIKTGNMSACQNAVERMRLTIREYLLGDVGGLVPHD